MAIFNSYVSLPEGKTQMCFCSLLTVDEGVTISTLGEEYTATMDNVHLVQAIRP
jgi:hypothetical protein